MTISKKHFKVIAEAISYKDLEAQKFLIDFLSPILKELNPNFSIEKFNDYIEKRNKEAINKFNGYIERQQQ